MKSQNPNRVSEDPTINKLGRIVTIENEIRIRMEQGKYSRTSISLVSKKIINFRTLPKSW